MLALLLGGCSELATPPTTSDTPARSSKTAEPTTTQTPNQRLDTSPTEGQLLPIEAHLYIGDRPEPILLEVARTPQQQMLGLMHRDRASLPENRGMLFPFERPRRAQFWMKNVKFSLDMLFISRGKIKAIAADVPPCVIQPCPVYGPDTPVEGVIELTGGQAAALNLRPGDAVTIEFLEDSAQSSQ
ncbi:MAG: DUF192 domain-containing protein [Spirulina sp. SIO3F2]|nr:DUF192 domain-containing protein [Spirulina sp. SIO3F2]